MTVLKNWIFTAMIILLMVPWANAHELRPAYLQITEVAADTFDVFWKVPARGGNQRLALNTRFDGDVKIASEPVETLVDNAHIRRWSIETPSGLAGTRITIDGLNLTITEVLLHVTYADGAEFVTRVQPDAPSIRIPATTGAQNVAWTYLVLGVEHILFGIDHLLFVLALILIIQGKGKLIGTITAFTVAHSITLILAALGYVSLPGPPVEAVIALSIVLVALETLRQQRGIATATARWPWIVAFLFGLLHGFGFAGALAEIGLPQKSLPLALFTFNLGVEIGQLLFVAMVLVLAACVRNVRLSLPVWSRAIAPYTIGSLAMFWVFERSWSYTLGALFG